MTLLVDNGDTQLAFDYRTSELVVTVVECEVARFKVNRVFLAYHTKVSAVLNTTAHSLMSKHVEEHPEETSNGNLFIQHLESWGIRLLFQRDKARDAGDELATTTLMLLHQQPNPKVIREALRRYVSKEGWGGPAMSWVRRALV